MENNTGIPEKEWLGLSVESRAILTDQVNAIKKLTIAIEDLSRQVSGASTRDARAISRAGRLLFRRFLDGFRYRL